MPRTIRRRSWQPWRLLVAPDQRWCPLAPKVGCGPCGVPCHAQGGGRNRRCGLSAGADVQHRSEVPGSRSPRPGRSDADGVLPWGQCESGLRGSPASGTGPPGETFAVTDVTSPETFAVIISVKASQRVKLPSSATSMSLIDASVIDGGWGAVGSAGPGLVGRAVPQGIWLASALSSPSVPVVGSSAACSPWGPWSLPR